jgi:hypothetical protein
MAETPNPATPAASATPEAVRRVTLDDDDQTLTLQVGEEFLLELGWDYNWIAQVDNRNVASRVLNIAVVRGAQGAYTANAPGHADLVATGVPTCRNATPPCDLPDRTFRIHLVVTEEEVPATP